MEWHNNKEKLLSKFWDLVDKTPGRGPWGDCWVWTGSMMPPKPKSNGTYGRIGFHYQSYYAHRMSWIIETGESLTQMELICHKCDNTLCVRPDHLFKGTHLDNVRDCMAKGRRADRTDIGIASRKSRNEGECWCFKCKQFLPENDFHFCHWRWNKRAKECKSCRKEFYRYPYRPKANLAR